MRTLILAATLVVSAALPAAAQTAAMAAPPATAAGPTVRLGVGGGASSVQKVGGLGVVEASVTATDRIDIYAEAGWTQNIAKRSQIETAQAFAADLGTRQGKTATGDLKAPAVFAGGGVRVKFPLQGSVTPYITVGAGVTHVTLQPAFTLGGSDVTPTLGTYGLTLGADLTGSQNKLHITGGFGALIDRGSLTFDISARLNSVQTDPQKTNVLRLQALALFKF